MAERTAEPMNYGEKVAAIEEQINFAHERVLDAIRAGAPGSLAEVAFWYGRMSGLRFGICALSFEKPIEQYP